MAVPCLCVCGNPAVAMAGVPRLCGACTCTQVPVRWCASAAVSPMVVITLPLYKG